MAKSSLATERVTVPDLQRAKQSGTKWSMLTAYDYPTARIFDDAGVDVLLVGDSAAMVVYGYDSTVPVTMEELLPLTKAVARGAKRALVLADLPFGSYQESAGQALASAVRFAKEAGAHAVKLEGGARVAPQIQAIAEAGIPVFGHLGLTPQSIHALGGYKVQGRGAAGDALLRDAQAVVEAGASALVLEVIPAELATRVTEEVPIPTIGIGAGAGTDAQVLVWQDLVGFIPGKAPKFVQHYATLGSDLADAVSRWTHDVAAGTYPDDDHSYH